MDNGYLTHSARTGMSQGLKYWESLMSMGACLVGSQRRFWMATKLILQTTAEITEYQTMLDLNCEIQFECCRCLYFLSILYLFIDTVNHTMTTSQCYIFRPMSRVYWIILCILNLTIERDRCYYYQTKAVEIYNNSQHCPMNLDTEPFIYLVISQI